MPKQMFWVFWSNGFTDFFLYCRCCLNCLDNCCYKVTMIDSYVLLQISDKRLYRSLYTLFTRCQALCQRAGSFSCLLQCCVFLSWVASHTSFILQFSCFFFYFKFFCKSNHYTYLFLFVEMIHGFDTLNFYVTGKKSHLRKTLKKYPFKGLGCYLLLGKLVVDHDFPSIEIKKMERLPMVPDPRYSEENQPSYEVWNSMKVAHSRTMRAPYPSQDELDELYGRKPASGKYDHSRDNRSPKMSLGGRR